MNQHVGKMPIITERQYYSGPHIRSDGWCEFRLHAPNAQSMLLTYSNDGINWNSHPMESTGNGNFHLEICGIRPGARYWYVIDGENGYPDPWSRYQPDGPHQASQIIDHRNFIWHDFGWQGKPWSEAVIYEMHVGTFTPAGTFSAAMERLKSLSDLGVTVVQVMPVWTVPGGPSWGYDANYIFSVNADYGHPDDFKRFVDAAHGLGIQVILDVIYNHLGIEGNYLAKFDQCWLLPDEGNQWGSKLNFDRPGRQVARTMVVSNALFWLQEYHLDGLRIDAPIEIEDSSDTHILVEMAKAVRRHFLNGRHIHLILENDHYAGRITDVCGDRLYDASLNIRGSECLINLCQDSAAGPDDTKISELMECLKANIGFEFTDEFPSGNNVSERIHSDCQIFGLQNHDLIGNQQTPQRIWSGLDAAMRELLLALMCFTPSAPSFFMGDEFGCEQVFPFFCNFADVSETDVQDGRVQDFEFSGNADGNWPPYAEHTFDAARLEWPDLSTLTKNFNYQLISSFLNIRRQMIVPLLQANKVNSSSYRSSKDSHHLVWVFENGQRLIFEFGSLPYPEPGMKDDLIYRIDGDLWSAIWRVE